MSKKSLSNRLGEHLARHKINVQRYKDLDSFARTTATEAEHPEQQIFPGPSNQAQNLTDQNVKKKIFKINKKITSISNASANPLPKPDIHFHKLLNDHYIDSVQNYYIDPNSNKILLDAIKALDNRLDALEKAFSKAQTDNKAQVLAQNKVQGETLVITKKIFKMMTKLVGEEKDEDVIEIENIFPIESIAAMSDLEIKLQDKMFSAKLDSYLRKFKGTSSLDSVFRFLAKDNVYHEFNLDGRANKRALNSLGLFKNVVFDACSGILGREKYEHELRKCVLHAHNRFFKNKTKSIK